MRHFLSTLFRMKKHSNLEREEGSWLHLNLVLLRLPFQLYSLEKRAPHSNLECAQLLKHVIISFQHIIMNLNASLGAFWALKSLRSPSAPLPLYHELEWVNFSCLCGVSDKFGHKNSLVVSRWEDFYTSLSFTIQHPAYLIRREK